MATIKLFHYSAEYRPVLKTLLAQRLVTLEQAVQYNKWAAATNDVLGYHKHISFFIAQHPVEDIAQFYPDGHPVWFKGNNLVEHVVEIEVGSKVLYKMVETKLCTDMLDSSDWSDTSDEFLIAYKQRQFAMQRKVGEIGRRSSMLQRQIQLNSGDVYPALKRVSKRSDYDEIKDKYAATVPHVMIYPFDGSMAVASHRVVTVG